MPSTESTVFVELVSVAVLSAWMIASVLARVDNANLCGEQVVCMGCENICAKLRDTKRRTTSPMTIPRTLPFGFGKATIRPSPRLGTMAAGTLACASCCATAVSRWVASSSSSMSRSVSAVRPDGPGAAPFFGAAQVVDDGGCWYFDGLVRLEGGNVGAGGLVLVWWPASWVSELLQDVLGPGCCGACC